MLFKYFANLSFLCLVNSFFQSFPTKRKNHQILYNELHSKSMLLKDPNPNSIGNFFDKSNEEMSFIQCYMLAMADVKGNQYGVGFPVDMPVMLTYFEGNELKPVKENFPNYEHLINHVSIQLESSNLNLYKTPVVLTLQGEFDDEQMNQIYTPMSSRRDDVDQEVEENEEGEEEDDSELTIDDVIAMEGLDDEDDDDIEYEDDDDDDDDINENHSQNDMNSFLNTSPAGKNNKVNNVPDISIYRPEKPDLSDIPADAIVTEEDTKSLRRAHRRADKIIQYAADVKLIASFHYSKQNFHLVKLLEPMFIVGKRMMDIKGYYFSLLDDEESSRITPIIEKMLINRPKQSNFDNEMSDSNRNDNSNTLKTNKIDTSLNRYVLSLH